jgi:glycosyltransferase involved in cell wall biosynthesis
MVNAGHHVSVVGINYDSEYYQEIDNGVHVYRLPRKRLKGLTWFLHNRAIHNKLSALNKTNPIDIIEGSELSFAFLPRISKIVYLIRLHGGHHFFAESENRGINYWKGIQERRSFRRADAVVGVSKYAVVQTSKYLSFLEKLKGIISCPLDISKFQTSASPKINKGRIFFVGTICEKKGIKELIQAIPIVKSAFPEASLHIAGRDWVFPETGNSYMQYVKQFIDPAMEDSIHFMGPISNIEIPNLLEIAEVCCYPSHMETFGIVAIEAMAMGKPVVFTKLGPGPEIIEHGETGFLCNPLDPKDIATQIISIMSNTENAKKIGEKAKESVITRFSIDEIGAQNIGLYESLL